METENIKENDAEKAENITAEEVETSEQEGQEASESTTETDELTKLQDELAESRDKYIRLYSEFDNFRRRTSKEKLDLIQTANEDLMLALIPIMDDFERAKKSFEEKETDIKAVKDGLHLIQDKFKKILEQKGLVVMDHKVGTAFDSEYHEAITQIPAPKKSLKGKIVDVIEKGYLLKDKVVRYAKVVIGN